MTSPFGKNAPDERNDSLLVLEPGQTMVDHAFHRAGYGQPKRVGIIRAPSTRCVRDCIA